MRSTDSKGSINIVLSKEESVRDMYSDKTFLAKLQLAAVTDYADVKVYLYSRSGDPDKNKLYSGLLRLHRLEITPFNLIWTRSSLEDRKKLSSEENPITHQIELDIKDFLKFKELLAINENRRDEIKPRKGKGASKSY